jgi:hypothetical protein
MSKLKRVLPTDGNKGNFFKQRIEEMYQSDPETYEKYFGYKDVVTTAGPIYDEFKDDFDVNVNLYTMADLQEKNSTLRFKYSNSSLKKLSGVDKALVDVYLEAANYMDIRIIWGYRTPDEQHDLYVQHLSTKDGYEKLSKHQLRKAVDSVPLHSNMNMFSGNKNNDSRWGFYNGFLMAIAAMQGTKIKVGWKWRSDPYEAIYRPLEQNTLVDSGHIELA